MQWIPDGLIIIILCCWFYKDTDSIEEQCCPECIKACYFDGKAVLIENIGIINNDLKETEQVCITHNVSPELIINQVLYYNATSYHAGDDTHNSPKSEYTIECKVSSMQSSSTTATQFFPKL